MHQKCNFFLVFWNGQNLAKKAVFWIILTGFLSMPSYDLWGTSQDFCKWKTSLKYIPGKFHQYTICGCQV